MINTDVTGGTFIPLLSKLIPYSQSWGCHKCIKINIRLWPRNSSLTNVAGGAGNVLFQSSYKTLEKSQTSSNRKNLKYTHVMKRCIAIKIIFQRILM